MVVILLLSFFLRVYRIGEQRVWWDEGWSVWVARFPTAEILRQTGNDVHPPLYFELLHVWRILSGDGEAGLRLLSAFLGTLAIALTFSLGRSMARGMLSRNPAAATGLVAALLLAVSRFAVAWSQEIRMYALAMVLGLLAVWAARRYWASGRASDGIAYVLATAAGLYTLYLFAPVWVAINAAWLWVLRAAPDRRGAFLRWSGLQVAVLALFLPWLLYAAGGFLSTASATPIKVLDFLHIYWTVLTVGIPVDVARYNRLTLPALAIFLAAILSLGVAVLRQGKTKNDRSKKSETVSSSISSRPVRDFSLLLVILLLPVMIVYFVSLPRQNFYNPPFNPRYLVIFTPFYSILLAWGVMTLGDLTRRRGLSRAAAGMIPVGLTMIFLAVALVGLRPYHPGRNLVDDYKSLVSTINAYRQPGDAVVLYSDTDWPIFAYHYPQPWRGVPHLWAVTPATAADFLEPIWKSHDAVWLVTTPYSAAGDPQRHLPSWLAERAQSIREFTYKVMGLTLFTKTDARSASADTLAQPNAPQPLDIPLPAGGRLVGYEQAARAFKSGDAIHLFLYYQGEAPIPTEVGLIDAANQAWGTVIVTLPPAIGTARQQVDILVPPEAPSGRYRFYIIDENLETAAFGRLMIRQKQTDYLFEDDVTITNRVGAQFGDSVRLLGYDVVPTTARAGETIDLTLYWSSDGDIRQRYKVFTHLLGDVFNAATGNFLWGQIDNEPTANTRPTTTWREAEVIVDEYAIPIAPDAPPGRYQIEIGLYDPVTGVRLGLLDPKGIEAGDHLILTEIEVAP